MTRMLLGLLVGLTCASAAAAQQTPPPPPPPTQETLDRWQNEAIRDLRDRQKLDMIRTLAEAKDEKYGAKALAKARREATQAAEKLGVPCEVASVRPLPEMEIYENNGRTEASFYELACADAPGWIITRTQLNLTAYDCLAIKSMNAKRAPDASTPPRPECRLPQNGEALPVLQKMAARAGHACAVESAAWIGELLDRSAMRYELGCKGRGSVVLEGPGLKSKAAPRTLDCLRSEAEGVACLGPRDAQIRPIAARPEVGRLGCEVKDARMVGGARSGARVYELNCGGQESVLMQVDQTESVTGFARCADFKDRAAACRFTYPAG